MNNLELLNYISLFREKAEQGKLVVFVGAGVSCNVAGMPDWNRLIQNMANAIGYSKCSSCRRKCENCASTCLLKNDYSADEFLKIPQYVFNKDKTQYDQVLTENISNDIVVDAPLSSAIFDINPAHIITTNYDHLLETSKNLFCEQYQVIIHDKDLLNASKSKYIIKMHGDMNEPDTIVLKEQDYLDYSQKHVLIELFIKALLTDHIVLFLGYSLNDYNIKLILSWLNYMRSQNDALDGNQEIGYILLDQEEIDDDQQAYFSGNNIGVININQMPLTQEIPEALSNDKGKRLYSFLRVIANPDLEEGMFSVENAVQFMSQYFFLSYDQIMKLLYIKTYEVSDWQLRLFTENDYVKLTSFMESGNEKSAILRQKLLNAGIISIYYFDRGNTKRFSVGNLSERSLIQDRLFNLYILNKYDELKVLLNSSHEDITPIEKYFYQSIVSGYSGFLDTYSRIDTSELQIEQKVAYLHNLAVVNSLQTLRFDSTKIKQFIQNIPLAKERNLFSGYLDFYNGNTKKRLTMHEALDKLKKDVGNRASIHFGGTSINKIYEIKRLIMTQYFFYFYNHILFQGFSDLSKFFKPYIEAIICANSDAAEMSSHFGDIEFVNEKYPLSYIDLDIITKFISVKDLSALIEMYHVKKLNIDTTVVGFLTNCFQNLCNSIITKQTFGFRQSSFLTLSNLILLLNLVDIEEDNKRILETSITSLVSDEKIMPVLFSIRWPDYKYTLQNLSKLCKSLSLSCDFEIVKRIVLSNNFFKYAVNVSFGSLRQLIVAFLPDPDKDISAEVKSIIDMTNGFHRKVILLRLFFQHISDEGAKKNYHEFLSLNFLHLSKEAIYDFVFSEWFAISPETAEGLLTKLLKTNQQQPNGVYSFPDPVETDLECVYLLYITNKITDITILEEMAPGRPHLQFLLNPERFDYSQVDFSNYMWANFAHQKRYMDYFVSHKDAIIPNIISRVEQNRASEVEKKILYGFLLNKDEVLRI